MLLSVPLTLILPVKNVITAHIPQEDKHFGNKLIRLILMRPTFPYYLKAERQSSSVGTYTIIPSGSFSAYCGITLKLIVLVTGIMSKFVALNA